MKPIFSVDVHWLRLDEPPWPDGLLETCLAPDEHARAARFYFPRDRQRFVRRRGMLRFVLGERIGIDPGVLSIVQGGNGRPELDRRHGSDVRFSQSSSGDFTVCAVTEQRDVGVDVERRRDDIEIELLAGRIFSAVEVVGLESEPAGDRRNAAFFACWTMKEAFVKAKGDGLSLPLDQFDVDFRSHSQPRSSLLATRRDPADAARWCLRSLTAPAGYSAALAVAAPCPAVSVTAREIPTLRTDGGSS